MAEPRRPSLFKSFFKKDTPVNPMHSPGHFSNQVRHNAPEHTPPHAQKPTPEHKDESLFHGHDQIEVGGYQGALREMLIDPEARKVAKDILQKGNPYKPVSREEIDTTIKDMVNKMDLGQVKGKISKAEVAMRFKKMHAHESIEKRKLDPYTPEGKKKISAMNEEMEFLEKKFKSEK